MTMMSTERVIDERLVNLRRTIRSTCRMCRCGTDAASSEDGDRRNRDQCTTSKIRHVELFSVLFPALDAE